MAWRALTRKTPRRLKCVATPGVSLHGKTYLVEDSATQAAIAGSSNMTYAGLAHNAELNLGTGGGTHSAQKVHEWFEHFGR